MTLDEYIYKTERVKIVKTVIIPPKVMKIKTTLKKAEGRYENNGRYWDVKGIFLWMTVQ